MKIEVHPNPPGRQPLRSLPVNKFGKSDGGDVYIKLATGEFVNLNYLGYSHSTPGRTGSDLDKTLVEVLPSGTQVTLTSE